MKTIHCLLIAMMISSVGSGQPLTGTKSIPGDYATIQAAIADLNLKTVGSGGVVFNVAANHTETFTNASAGLITASGNAADSIVFRKGSSTVGNNPKITAFTPGTSTTVDGIIKIAGGDYIVFDGIDLQENGANNTATKQMEWGYALVKKQNTAPFDGCQNVTIRNCNVSLNKANTASVGIYAGNHVATAKTSLSITATTDACNNTKIYNNFISNVCTGISITGYSASSPYILYDHNNSIGESGKNTIANFGGGNGAAYGVNVSAQDQVKIMNDSIVGGTGTTNLLVGINLGSSTSSGAEVSGNYISLTSGTTTNINTYGIWNSLGGSPAGNCVKIHHNIIKDCSSNTAATGSLYGILNNASADTVKIFNNTISGASLSGSGTNFGIRTDASSTRVFINNNTISDFTNTGSGNMTLIYTSSTNTMNISHNTISNCAASGGTVYGIHSGSGNTNWNAYGNNLFNISSNIGSTATAIVYGIYNLGSTNYSIYNNIISDLKANSATNNPSICGMYLAGGTNAKIYYNTVYLDASSTGSSFGSAAIYSSVSPTIDLRNNILVNVSTPGVTGYTVAYRRSSATLLNNYSANSNFNDFFAGTPGPNNLIFYNGTSGDQTMADFQLRVSPRDAASFSENPPFINITTTPCDLHLSDSVPTLCESGGSTITSPVITTDFEDEARYPNPGYPDNTGYPATSADVGADEFGGLRLDNILPVIAYTPLINTSSTAARTLSATITDIFSGIPDSGDGLPVLYWKINNSTSWNSSTGVPSAGDQFTFTFGAGVSTGDVVYYYLCAQDGFSSPNVTAFPSEGASGCLSNPPSCSTPPDIPDGYRIVATLPSGSYRIGGTAATPSPGCAYVDITQAFADIDNAVTSITVTNGGSGYTFTPVITLVGGHGNGAQAIAYLSGDTIGLITVTNPGKNYLTPPIVQISGGGGTGATATAIIGDGKEVTGPVEFLLDSTYSTYEEDLFPLQIRSFAGASPVNTITLKPAPNTTHMIITNASPSIFKLDGVDFFTLDGSGNGSGSRDLDIWNTSSGAGGAIVWIANGSLTDGATNNTIKNCILRGNILTSTLTGIFSGGSSSISLNSFATTPNSFNTYTNNLIYKEKNGMILLGISPQEPDLNTVINANTLGQETSGEGFNNFGILATNQSNAVISGNHIRNIVYNDHYNEVTGIYLKDVKTSVISGNEIHNLSKTLVGDGFPVDGIFQRSTAFNTTENPSNNLYYNNLIYNLFSNGTSSISNVVGIHNNGGWGDKYYFNTVFLSGQMNGPGVTYSLSGCFANGKAINSGYAGNIEVLNNIFRIDGYSPPGNYVTDTAFYYAHYSVLTSMSGSVADYNDLKASATGRAKAFTGNFNSIDYLTLPSWQAGTGQELHSLDIDPAFVSSTDLHPQAQELNDAGSSISGITVDFEGVLRGTPPDIGAYEFTSTSTIWTGLISGDWSNPVNWSSNAVPGPGESVIIPGGTANNPQVLTNYLSCNDLTILQGASLIINPGTTFTVNGQLILQQGSSVKKLNGGELVGSVKN